MSPSVASAQMNSRGNSELNKKKQNWIIQFWICFLTKQSRPPVISFFVMFSAASMQQVKRAIDAMLGDEGLTDDSIRATTGIIKV